MIAHYWRTLVLWGTLVAVHGFAPTPSHIGRTRRAAFSLPACPLDALNEEFTPSPGSLSGQTIVITGGTSGLGLESAKRLAAGGASIVLTARSDAKGQQAVEQVRQYVGTTQNAQSDAPSVSYKVLDLDNLQSLRDASLWDDVPQIDVLLNNAGVMALPRLEVTVDGYERQMQSNHLGHFLLTSVLAPKLVPGARIINVSSTAHQMVSPSVGLLSGPALWKPDAMDYAPWAAYGQSKLANIHFTKELQRRSDAANKDWTVVCLHPGVVATDLGRYLFGTDGSTTDDNPLFSVAVSAASNLFTVFLKTPAQGATTQVWLASRADNVPVKGQYLSDCKVQPLASYATDPLAGERLWKESEEKAGITFSL